ncbi:MAG: acyltransferase family protein [Rhodoferax sp.]
MNAPAQPSHNPLVQAVKALASQLIVWHHLVFYGPLSDLVQPHATVLFDWLYDQARIAVQAFLVVGGFLAARSLSASFSAPQAPPLWALLRQRYLRLLRPYLPALALALLGAALARAWAPLESVPTAPTVAQLLAHLALLQDVLGIEALSAGVWYVAIDWQLFALLALLMWAARRLTGTAADQGATLASLACAALTAASLWGWNRDAGLDAWAPYFFGAYGLGVLAQRACQTRQRMLGAALLLLLVGVALFVQWRTRILVAGVTALLLLATAQQAWQNSAPTRFLADISYALFLVHYPVFLIVASTVHHLWPHSVAMAALGMLLSWALSVAAATVLHRLTERRAR